MPKTRRIDGRPESSARAASGRGGFTLLELLVVIGIIVVLVGILFPIIKKVQITARLTDTQQEITQISNAIEAYYADFHAYPGAAPNFIAANSSGIDGDTYALASGGSVASTVTGTENLVLALSGGFYMNGNIRTYDVNRIGTGPDSMNMLNPHHYKAYFTPQPSDLSTALPTNTPKGMADGPDTGLSGTGIGGDSLIPEYLDHFPAPMPILYIRARVGAPGAVDSGGNRGVCQYDVNQLDRYGVQYDPRAFPPQSNGNENVAGSCNYFMDPSIPPTNSADAENTGTPRMKDRYWLIAAGKDRKFGTADDQTQFGNVR